MRVTLPVESFPVRNGFCVRTDQLGLAGGGPTLEAAAARLREAVTAWCSGLRRAGELEGTLDGYGVTWSEEGPGVAVDIVQDDCIMERGPYR